MLLLIIMITIASMMSAGLLLNLLDVLWWKPSKVRKRLSNQGITGPKPSFLLGNITEMRRFPPPPPPPPPPLSKHGLTTISHQWAHSLLPFFNHWTRLYGSTVMFSLGNITVLYVSDHDLVKEILVCTSPDLGKPIYLQKERGPLLGQGILTSNGPSWAYQRKIIAPELYMDKVKGMCDIMIECTNSLVRTWESKIETENSCETTNHVRRGDIRIDEDLRSFSADIISRACFDSDYGRGRQIFVSLRALQQAMSRKSFLMGLPGLKYVPTKNNRDVWRLQKEIHSLILKVVEERNARRNNQRDRDLLQTIIEGANDKNGKNFDLGSAAKFIVDNCKNIYFAGHETTAMSACWTLLLLALNPAWQTRVRDEILQLHGSRPLHNEMLHKMKLLTMVIQESLRLYPTVVFMSRQALEDISFGEGKKIVQVPKGVNIWIPVITLHREVSIWGNDADEFKPERFVNGVSGACKVPQLYLPFGGGPRICAGQHLAMIELKILLSHLLVNFSFSVSPTYKHSPVLKLVIEPEHGLNLIVQKL